MQKMGSWGEECDCSQGIYKQGPPVKVVVSFVEDSMAPPHCLPLLVDLGNRSFMHEGEEMGAALSPRRKFLAYPKARLSLAVLTFGASSFLSCTLWVG